MAGPAAILESNKKVDWPARSNALTPSTVPFLSYNSTHPDKNGQASQKDQRKEGRKAREVKKERDFQGIYSKVEAKGNLKR